MQLIWHLINIAQEREREIKLLPQTHRPEVDYSLIMLTVLVMLEKISGMAPAAFLLQSL
jgi:hypothetical protein